MQERSAGAVVFCEAGKKRLYLILNYGAGHWDFPKGHVESKESVEETARREILEETGLKDVKLVPGFEHKISYFFTKNKRRVHKEVVFLLAETKSEKIKLSFEHKGFKWLSYGKASERLTFKNAKDVLEKAEGFLDK
ncbi:MAG: NUDIX domain-containing protein [Candidatus Aenigmatarchaeota archaeon]